MDGPFDRTCVRRNRDRTASVFADHRFLYDLALDRLSERLQDIQRSFPCAIYFGPGLEPARRAALRVAGGVDVVIQADLARTRLDPEAGPCVQVDAQTLAFADGSVDLVLSVLDLHTINDLPGALVQIRRALRPDGVFLAALWGGETLGGLRQALVEVETRLRGGASVRVAPFADAPTLAGLMQRAGFALSVVDTERIVLTYADPVRLFADLKGMGESNALRGRRRGLESKDLFSGAAKALAGQDVRLDMIFLIGWAPHASQPAPLKPGSATARLEDFL